MYSTTDRFGYLDLDQWLESTKKKPASFVIIAVFDIVYFGSCCFIVSHIFGKSLRMFWYLLFHNHNA